MVVGISVGRRRANDTVQHGAVLRAVAGDGANAGEGKALRASVKPGDREEPSSIIHTALLLE